MADTGEKSAKLTLESIASNEVAFSAGYSKGHKVKARNAKTPALIAILALAVTGFATVRYTASAQEVSNLRADYTLERATYEDISVQLVDARTQGALLLSNCASSVDDPALCEALQKSLVEAEHVDVTDPGKIDPYDADGSQLKIAVRTLTDINTKATPAYKTLTAAINAVQTDTSSKTRDDFEKVLVDGKELVTKARELVESTENRVWNDSLRTETLDAADALEESLKKAEEADKKGIRDYTGVTMPIEKSMDNLRKHYELLAEYTRLWEQENTRRPESSVSPNNTGQNQGQQNQGNSQGSTQGGSQGGSQGGQPQQPSQPYEDNQPANPDPEVPDNN